MHAVVSAKFKALAVPKSDAVMALYPEARILQLNGFDAAVLDYTPTTTFHLRNMGFEIDAPILHTYDWPGDRKPFDVQRKTCAMLVMNRRAYVLNGMGTGKTKAALWAWDYLYSNKLAKKLLVIAPLSTLKFTWANEVFRTLSHRVCRVLYGTRDQRIKALAEDADIYVVNHDGYKLLREELAKRTDIDTLVIDELSVYRNSSAARTKTMIKDAARFNIIWGMTGSPMPNEPTDVWAPARILTPNSVPQHFGKFRDMMMLKVSQFTYVPKLNSTQRAYEVMQPAVRYTLDDILELPEAVDQITEIEMGPQQKKIYKALATTCFAALQNNQITAVNAGALLVKLLQVSSGWVYDKDKKIVALDGDNRTRALIDAINATDRKVLVFTAFKHTLAGISAALTADGIDHAVVSGDTSPRERGDIFTAFQNSSKYKAILAHPQTMAHGLTLTEADTMIWHTPITSLEIFEQAKARIRRVGQTHKQLYLYFTGSPVEKKLYAMLQKRQSLQECFLELFEEATKLT